MVDRGQGGEHLGALAGTQDGPAGSLQAPHGGVVVQPDDQHVAERARRGEIAHVPGMEQVEAAVGEDDAGARGTAVASTARSVAASRAILATAMGAKHSAAPGRSQTHRVLDRPRDAGYTRARCRTIGAVDGARP